MDDAETYDIWAIRDDRGPVVYVPVATGVPVAPAELVARHRRDAAGPARPEGVIEGVWERARPRLVAASAQLTAEIVDPEVPTGRAAARAATMARGEEAVAWAPEVLLREPEKPARQPRARSTAGSRGAAARPARPVGHSAKKPSTPRTTAPKLAAPPAPPPERPCRRCFMLRRPEQLDIDGTCLGGCL